MKPVCKLLVAGVALLAATSVAHAETGKMYVPYNKGPIVTDTHAAVVDMNGNPVRSTSGNCVRTQWVADCDPCAPQPAPAPQVQIPLEARTVYFPLNKAKLSAESRHKLDTLAATIKAQGPVKSVRVAGYADRLGSAVHNEKLSKQRADAVRKYLVSKGIVAAQVVETRWFGDTNPATQCPKDMKRKELVACLQRDRRVEVEVDFAPAARAMTAPAPVAPHKAMHHKKDGHAAKKAVKKMKK